MRLQSNFLEDFTQEIASSKLVDEKTGDFDMKNVSGALSMMIWGLIVAKAKAGQVAAVSKDHVTVKSQYKNAAILIVLVGIATFGQWKLESSFQAVKSTKNEASSSNQGRNLRATLYESNTKNIEVVDHDSVLQKAINAWKQDIEYKSGKNKKTLQSNSNQL